METRDIVVLVSIAFFLGSVLSFLQISSSYDQQINQLEGEITHAQAPKIWMVETGTEWISVGEYKLNNSIPLGYDGTFMVIFEIVDIYHDLTCHISDDILILKGGSIISENHETFIETIRSTTEEWYYSRYVPFDISSLSDGQYTVIVTVTDLISGESNSNTTTFNITLP